MKMKSSCSIDFSKDLSQQQATFHVHKNSVCHPCEFSGQMRPKFARQPKIGISTHYKNEQIHVTVNEM